MFIFANMAAMSRMEEYFPEPMAYHPERWLRDERASMRTTWPDESGFLSLGFSHGMRACPGRRFAEQGLYLAIVSVSVLLNVICILYIQVHVVSLAFPVIPETVMRMLSLFVYHICYVVYKHNLFLLIIYF